MTLSKVIDEIDYDFYYISLHQNDKRIDGAFKYNAVKKFAPYLNCEVIDITPSENSSIAIISIEGGGV